MKDGVNKNWNRSLFYITETERNNAVYSAKPNQGLFFANRTPLDNMAD